MHTHSIEAFRHEHDHSNSTEHHEVRTRWVVVITALMMVGELVIGALTNSMALTADGWHMATHAGALGMSAVAYWFARTRARESSFTFGTGKVYALAGYTSAVVLGLVAVLMLVESARRLAHPLPIQFGEALPVAVVGLIVNLVSVLLLDADEHHGHHHSANHGHAHDHDRADAHGHGHDHNLRAAYFHVLADAFTSVLAIAALVAGRYAGWTFLDPAMGIVGGLVILKWGVGLCRDSAKPLLDVVPSSELAEDVQRAIESVDDVRVADLHLWEMGPGRTGCIVSMVTAVPRDTSFYRKAILDACELAHLTVEVHRCPDHEAA
jgi:cation diffusion facilitator family transporter